jgi:outer membrane protein assembly factor BamB
MMHTQTSVNGWAGVLGLLRAAGDRRRTTLLGSVVAAGVLTALWFSALAGPAHAAGMTEGWTKVASGGFTDRNNSYAPATIEFKGYLYLSTVANEAGFVFSKSHKLGGDIWRSRDGIKWEQVGTPGLGNTHNSSFNFVTFHNKLYALANNLNDHGIEIWVTEDGQHFTQIEKGGFGDPHNDWAAGFVFNDRLIIEVSVAASGAQIWVSDDGLAFRQVVSGGLGDEGNTGVLKPVITQTVMDGKLYVGTSNPNTGGEIWRTADGLQWERVADKGLERSSNTSLTPFLVFKGQLYAIGVSAGGLDKLNGLEVYRSASGTNWQKVVTDGFGQGKERNITGSLVEFQDRLYLATNPMDPRILVPGHPMERLPPRGFQLWVSDDGAKWTQVGKDGFGASTTIVVEVNVIGDVAYLSAFDYRQGSQLWRSTDGHDWKLIYREPDPSFFGMGGGPIDFKGHLLWMDNDLANGLEIWRRDVESGRSQSSRP